jgi:hypothetical protein
MSDLKDPRLIYLKGFLFIAAGCLASGLLLAESPSLKILFLLVVAVWCFARGYYFAFYVIEHYVDPQFRFAGLWDFAKYLIRRRPKVTDDSASSTPPWSD